MGGSTITSKIVEGKLNIPKKVRQQCRIHHQMMLEIKFSSHFIL